MRAHLRGIQAESGPEMAVSVLKLLVRLLICCHDFRSPQESGCAPIAGPRAPFLRFPIGASRSWHLSPLSRQHPSHGVVNTLLWGAESCAKDTLAWTAHSRPSASDVQEIPKS